MADEYQPRSILLTGGLGFIGSHVAIQLAKRYNYKIIILDKLDECASRNNISEVTDNVKVIIGDICSIDLVRHILSEYKIDTIMHFAAQTHVDNSFGNSITFTQNNIIGTHVLLEAATSYVDRNNHDGIRRFIHVSTDEVYGETNERMKEHMTLAPTNPYAATKAGAEFLARSYHTSFEIGRAHV